MQKRHDYTQDNHNFNQIVGNNIRLYRQQAGYTQEALAESVKISTDSIYRIESGCGVKADTLWDISLELKIPLSCLYSGIPPVKNTAKIIVELIELLYQLLLEQLKK